MWLLPVVRRLKLLDKALHFQRIPLAVAVAPHGTRAARRFNKDVAEQNAGIDADGCDVGDVDGVLAAAKKKGVALTANVDGQLAQIEEALSRLDDGSYGTCQRCGKAITEARLEALPFATLCIDCQAYVENVQ